MAICDDCAHRRDCTFPRTESTRSCDEYDDSPASQTEDTNWDLTAMLAGWGFTAPGKA